LFDNKKKKKKVYGEMKEYSEIIKEMWKLNVDDIKNELKDVLKKFINNERMM
jgi:hypothetical protein